MKLQDYSNLFSQGESVSLNQVLENREKRVMYIHHLLEKYQNSSVIAFKANTPGPIKSNALLNDLCENCENEFENSLSQLPVVFKNSFSKITGFESFFVVEGSAGSLKKNCVDFESSKIGRLFDADVLTLQAGSLTAITRESLGIPERKCFICNKPAKVCGSRRLHSAEELQAAFERIVSESY